MIISDVAPIIPEIKDVTNPEELLRFCRGVQVALDRKSKTTRRDLDYVYDSIPTLPDYKQKKTYNTKYGFWGDVWYKDADEIIIKPKSINGLSWIGACLNDGTYLESSTAITAKLAIPGASGHIVDGITAVLNSSIYALWLYNSGGTLTPAFTLLPITTFSNANPTNTLTLGQINAQDAGFIFPVGAHVVVWQDTNEFEAPYFYSIDAGAATVDVTADKPKVSSRTSTVLTLGADLTNATFTAGSTVYQTDNFQPLRLSDGANAFGTDGYLDTGIRIITDAIGNIRPFTANEDFLYGNNTGTDYDIDGGVEAITGMAAWTNYRLTCVPPDKRALVLVYGDSYLKTYWEANGRHVEYSTVAYGSGVPHNYITHSILSHKGNGAKVVVLGYRI